MRLSILALSSLFLFSPLLKAEDISFSLAEDAKPRVAKVPAFFDAAPIFKIYDEAQKDVTSQNPEIYFTHPVASNVSGRIVEMINEAKELILVNAYAITDPEIANALLRAQTLRSVPVILILEGRPAIRSYRTPTFFIENSIITLFSQDEGFNNNSYIIIDKKTVITGSYQYTQSSATKNAENLVIFKDNTAVAAKYYLNFITHLSLCEVPEMQKLKKPNLRDDVQILLQLKK